MFAYTLAQDRIPHERIGALESDYFARADNYWTNWSDFYLFSFNFDFSKTADDFCGCSVVLELTRSVSKVAV